MRHQVGQELHDGLDVGAQAGLDRADLPGIGKGFLCVILEVLNNFLSAAL